METVFKGLYTTSVTPEKAYSEMCKHVWKPQEDAARILRRVFTGIEEQFHYVDFWRERIFFSTEASMTYKDLVLGLKVS